MDRNPIPPLTSSVNRVLDENAKRLRTLERQEVDTWTPLLIPLVLPDLRAFWPISSADEAGNIYDVSGQARTLTNNGGVGRQRWATVLPYLLFDGVNDYLSRADEAGLELGQAFTVGFWAQFLTLGTEQGLIEKWATAGNQRSWRIYKTAADLVRFEVSQDGAAATVAGVSTGAVVANTWYSVTARFSTSTEVTLFLNEIEYNTVASVPNTAFNNTAAFEIGRTNGTAYFDGALTMPWLAGSAYNDDLIKLIYRQTMALYQVG